MRSFSTMTAKPAIAWIGRAINRATRSARPRASKASAMATPAIDQRLATNVARASDAGTLAETSQPDRADTVAARMVSTPSILVVRNAPASRRLWVRSSSGSLVPTKSSWRSRRAMMTPLRSDSPVFHSGGSCWPFMRASSRSELIDMCRKPRSVPPIRTGTVSVTTGRPATEPVSTSEKCGLRVARTVSSISGSGRRGRAVPHGTRVFSSCWPSRSR